jgi:hypothetical protein
MSSRLTEILSKSKAIMQKAEQEYGTTSNSGGISNNTSHEEKEMPNLTENFSRDNTNTNKSVAPQNGRYRNMENSKMPDFIKQAMLEEPIDIPESPYPTFNIEDVPELVNETQVRQPNLEDSRPSPKKNVDTNNIRQIVREEMEGVVRSIIEEYLDKSLVTEDIQIKVGNTIFSGNLKPLPRKKR